MTRPKIGQPYFKPGAHNRICQRTGFKIKSTNMQREWSGSTVRTKSWEPRNSQDLLRSFQDHQQIDDPNPESADTFLAPNQVVASDLDGTGKVSSELRLTVTGAVVATADNQIFDLLNIIATSGTAFDCSGFNNVMLKRSSVQHGSKGVRISNSRNFTLEDVEVVGTSAPAIGAYSDAGHNNVEIVGGSHDSTATRVRVRSGSTGFYVLDSDRVILTNIEGYDQRGPLPRGQLVQFNKSNDCILQDFSTENDRDIAWTEDNVSVFGSDNVIVRRGIVDGNNSPSGTGYLAEQEGSLGTNVLFEDVDAINQGNGGASNVQLDKGVGTYGAVMRRVRVRGMVNTSWQSRGTPSSSNGNTTSGLHFWLPNGGDGTFVETCKYHYVAGENDDLPLNLMVLISTATFNTDQATDLAAADFMPRAKQNLTMPWEFWR